jgi:hypothetical protein
MRLVMLLLVLATIPASPFSHVVPLYDGARGTTPDRQGMVLLTNPLAGAAATQVFADGATTLDTSVVRSESAGYFGSGVPVLDRTAGYSLFFTVELPLEQHDPADRNGDGVFDRAGFSVIALSSDRRGIELGFWSDRVWAQDDARDGPGELFTQAEGAALDTAPRRVYELRVAGDDYTLFADGAAVFGGPLRDYTSFAGFPDPYETPNLIFLGDDTASAGARVRLVSIAVQIKGHALALPLVVLP